MGKVALLPKRQREEKEKAPVHDWLEYKDELGRAFAAQIRRARDLAEKRKEIEAQERELRDGLLKAMMGITEKSVLVDQVPVTFVHSVRKSIDASKLLEKGVDPDIIDYATKETPSDFLRIGAARDDDAA